MHNPSLSIVVLSFDYAKFLLFKVDEQSVHKNRLLIVPCMFKSVLKFGKHHYVTNKIGARDYPQNRLTPLAVES